MILTVFSLTAGTLCSLSATRYICGFCRVSAYPCDEDETLPQQSNSNKDNTKNVCFKKAIVCLHVLVLDLCHSLCLMRDHDYMSGIPVSQLPGYL